MSGARPDLAWHRPVSILVRLRLAGLPDFSVQIKHRVAEGDKVATLKIFSGTHEGEFMGIPPTGSRVSFDVFDLLCIRDGKMVEHWERRGHRWPVAAVGRHASSQGLIRGSPSFLVSLHSEVD